MLQQHSSTEFRVYCGVGGSAPALCESQSWGWLVPWKRWVNSKTQATGLKSLLGGFLLPVLSVSTW